MTIEFTVSDVNSEPFDEINPAITDSDQPVDPG